MSNNLQQLLKRLIVVVLCALISAGGALALYRSALQKRALQYELDRLQRDTEQQKIQSAAPPPRISQPVPVPPIGNSARPSNARGADLSNIEFSPDGKFVSAMVGYSTTSQLMLWPASGGSTLYRHEPHYYQADRWFWRDKTHLLSNGKAWQFHKNAGRWQLTSTRQIYALGLPNGNSERDTRDFPSFDLRLVLTDSRPTKNNPFVLRSTLEAYALSSGVRLPLPEQLKTDGGLDRVTPLARWGKTPLRIAIWLDDEQRTAQGPRDRSRLEVWDARAKKRLWQKSVPATPGKLLIAEQGRRVVAAGLPAGATPSENAPARNVVTVFDALTGKRQSSAAVPGLQPLNAIVSPNGKLLALYSANHNRKTGRRQKQLAIYDLPALRLVKTLSLTSRDELPELAFSPDNRWLAVENAGQIILLEWRKTSSDAAPKSTLRL